MFQNLFILSAASSNQLVLTTQRLYDFLTQAEQDAPDLTAIAYTLQVGRRALAYRLALMAATQTELLAGLQAFLAGDHSNPQLIIGKADHGVSEVAKPQTALEAAHAWVAGSPIAWQQLWNQASQRPKRIPLPTYPFAEASHSIAITNAASNHAKPQPAQQPSPAQPELVLRVAEYLRGHFCAVAELAESIVDLQAPLEIYGINSQLMTQTLARLEHDLGSLSKTLFFEHQTLFDLATHLSKTHATRWATILGIEPQPEQPPQPVALPQPQTQLPSINNEPIAIIGLAGRYPQADSIAEFWQLLANGNDCIREIPLERWDYRPLFNPNKAARGSIYAKWGGFLNNIAGCDPRFFNIAPREMELTDPQERLFLEVAWETFEDAGYTRSSLRQHFNGQIGVFVGVMYAEYQLWGAQEALKGHNVALGSSPGSIANRISHFFNLNGPSLAIDTMCSSTLMGLHLAVQSIRNRECQAALVGGVNLSLHPNKYLMHSQMNMLSTDGHCRSFGAGGDGFVPGEAVGAVLLKPLSQAERDGDHIYGLIKASAVNNDGKTNGYTVPNPVAQTAVIKQALVQAAINPRTISYIEAHGTGTALGDPIEIVGLNNAFRDFTTDRQFCAIGSVKSNIGHCEAAAGIAGLTKVLLQLKHQQLVPSLHAEQLNPNIDFEQSPFFVQQGLTAWQSQTPRRAGISSFGAGGVNTHVIIEEYPAAVAPTSNQSEQPYLVVLSAKTPAQLQLYAQRLADFIAQSSGSGAPVNLEQQILNSLSDVLRVDPAAIDPAEALEEYGFDAIMLAELARSLSVQLEREILPAAIIEYGSLNALVSGLNPSKSIQQPSTEPLNLRDLAYTLQIGREAFEERLTIIASNLQMLQQQLTDFATHELVQAESMARATINRNHQATADFSAEEIAVKDWQALAQHWLSGARIDWAALPQNQQARRISLPTYPFAREQHWIEIVPMPQIGSNIQALHPLIDANQSTFERQCFQKSLVANDPLLLAGSQGGYLHSGLLLEMALAAARISSQQPSHMITLTIDECEPRFTDQQLWIQLTPTSAGCEYHISLDSVEHQAIAWGNVNSSEPQPQATLDLAALVRDYRSANAQFLSQQEVYQQLQTIDIACQPWLEQVAINGNQAWASLAAAFTNSDYSDFVVVPAVWEAACQAVALLSNQAVEATLLVNYATIKLAQSLAETKHIVIVQTEAGYTLNFADQQGLILGIAELELRQSPSDVITEIELNPSNRIDNPTQTTIDLPRIAATILKYDPAQLDLHVPISEYGFDSVMLTEFINQINREYGQKLVLAQILQLNQPTLAAIDALISIQTPPPVAAPPTRPTPTKVQKSMPQPKTIQRQRPTMADAAEPIAVIGMSGRFPQADDLNEFWEVLRSDTSAIGEIPAERWDWQAYAGDPQQGNKTRIKWGGFLRDIAGFDAAFFNISPTEARLMDPQQRLFLETVWHTIEDAGYRPSALNGSRTGVFVGVNAHDYERLMLEQGITIEAHSATGNAHAILANRVSYLFDWHGPSEAIDTACSSSAVAIHHAIQALRNGDADLALAGGVHLLLSPHDFISYNKAGMLSESGRVKTFDAAADGYLRGEGVGAVLLKPLAQAERDGDPIYAVILGSAVNHNGRGFALTVPNPNGQADVIARAYQNAGVDPASVSYIEAQGTGTTLGDPVEIMAFTEVFKTTSTVMDQPCLIGSLKPHIGHLEAASGVAALIKLILALRHSSIPATLNLETINPQIELTETRFQLAQQPQAWQAQPNTVRRAGLHSFGVGGSNAHLIVEEYSSPQHSSNQHEPALIVLSAKQPTSLRAMLIGLQNELASQPELNIHELAYTLQVGREAFEHRVAFIAESVAALSALIERYLAGEPASEAQSVFEGALRTIDPALKRLLTGKSGELLITAALAERDLGQVAQLWTQGAFVSWNTLYPANTVQRLHLPGYHFEHQQFWFDQTPNSTPTTQPISLMPVMSISTELAELQAIFGNVLGIPAAQIDPSEPLENYGIDSVLMTKVKYLIEEKFAITIPLALLSQQATLETLNQHIPTNAQKTIPDLTTLSGTALDDLFIQIQGR